MLILLRYVMIINDSLKESQFNDSNIRNLLYIFDKTNHYNSYN